MTAAITAEQITTALALAGVFGLAATIGYFRQTITALQAAVEAHGNANAELRAEIGDYERRRAEDRRRCDEELGHLRVKVGELESQRRALSAEFGREIAGAIADEWTTRRDGLATRVDALERYHEDHDAAYRRTNGG